MVAERTDRTSGPDPQPDVLVVGAGPTGLTLAARLDAAGGTVRIVDRQLDRVHESRALAVQPRTLEVLRGLGISRTLVERGNDALLRTRGALPPPLGIKRDDRTYEDGPDPVWSWRD